MTATMERVDPAEVAALKAELKRKEKLLKDQPSEWQVIHDQLKQKAEEARRAFAEHEVLLQRRDQQLDAVALCAGLNSGGAFLELERLKRWGKQKLPQRMAEAEAALAAHEASAK